jgi:hypothetical protein
MQALNRISDLRGQTVSDLCLEAWFFFMILFEAVYNFS